MRQDERQVAPTIDGIRRDHVARYEWAIGTLPPNSKVIDFACGVGYGTNLVAKAGHTVTGYDIDAEAIAYAKEHYAHPNAEFKIKDGNGPGTVAKCDVAICFETVEHIADPRPLLKSIRAAADGLLVSVPNEDVFPWNNIAYHFRHYTKAQFTALLNECGWDVVGWFGQMGPESDVEEEAFGRTLIAGCRRMDAIARPTPIPANAPRAILTKPKHVAILGLGPSLDQYTNIVKRLGGRHKYADEVWTINALGSVFDCDRVFHMDDVRIQEIRAAARPESNIAGMLEWMRKTKVPIVTSRPHPDYPTTEPFPLIEVLNDCQYAYFNSTAAYAVAYAVWLGVEKLSIFGCDYTYPNAHDAEKGRACVEFWLGIAVDRGIRIVVPKNTTLLDALHSQREKFYGYDTLDLRITADANGTVDIEFSERATETLPDAEAIEKAYDHDVHPNALMVEAA